jgi:hypothetical protein
MDHEKFRNLSQAVHSLVLTVGIVVGGIWAMVTFNLLERTEKARADLAIVRAGLDGHAALEIDLDIRAMHDGGHQLLAVTARLENSGTRRIEIDFGGGSPLSVIPIAVDPDGAVQFGAALPQADASQALTLQAQQIYASRLRALALQSSVESVRAAVEQPAQGDLDIDAFLHAVRADPRIANDPSYRAFLASSRRYVVRAGTTERLDFLLKLPDAGLYKVEFTALVPPAEQADVKGAERALAVRWSAHRFVQVDPLKPAR